MWDFLEYPLPWWFVPALIVGIVLFCGCWGAFLDFHERFIEAKRGCWIAHKLVRLMCWLGTAVCIALLGGVVVSVIGGLVLFVIENPGVFIFLLFCIVMLLSLAFQSRSLP